MLYVQGDLMVCFVPFCLDMWFLKCVFCILLVEGLGQSFSMKELADVISPRGRESKSRDATIEDGENGSN